MTLTKRIILLSFVSIATFSAALITPALPQIAHEFNVPYGHVSFVVSLFLMGYVFGQLIYGPLANRYGRLTSLRIGMVVNLIGVFLCIAALAFHHFPSLLIARLITALGASAGLVCTLILISEYFDEKEAKNMLAYVVLSFTLGMGVAVFIGGFLIQYLGLMSCFYFLLIYGVFSLLATFIFEETLKTPSFKPIVVLLKGFIHALKNKQLVYYSLVLSLCSGISYCYSAAGPLIAHTELTLTPSEYGSWNLINIVGMFLSSFIARYLLALYTPKKVINIAYWMIGLSLFLLCLMDLTSLHSSLAFFILTMMLFLAGGLCFPAASFYALNAAKDDKASGTSMMSFINMGSATMLVIIMGYIPFNHLSAFISILTILMALLLLFPIVFSLKE
jgi:MFS family permease